MKRLCVYCGSNRGVKASYAEAAAGLGRAMVARGLGLVYGGGNVGLMGVIADAVLAAGGHVIGVIPEALYGRELGHQEVDELLVVPDMHERKAKMAALSDGFVAMPGGLGTLEELFEAWTWSQLGYHHKPVGLLDVDGYYDPLLAFLDHAEDQGFIKPEHRVVLVAQEDPEALLDALQAHHAKASA